MSEKLPRYPDRRAYWRHLRFGLSTVLGLNRLGFFIPYRYAGQLPDIQDRGGYSAIERLFAEADFSHLFDRIADYADDLCRIGGAPPPAPRFDQSWFPTLDAVIAYVLLRERRPCRLIEVGSGHSSRFFAQAIADGGIDCHFTAIDPAPRAILKGLPIEFVAGTLDQVDPSLFEDLRAGDVLSIDSSHILMPGTDVDDLFNRFLPTLPVGVLVHIHDIFLPDHYPPDWTWRGYNEQQAVAPMLTGRAYRTLFASHYAATRMADRLAATIVSGLPTTAEARPASLWLEKVRAS